MVNVYLKQHSNPGILANELQMVPQQQHWNEDVKPTVGVRNGQDTRFRLKVLLIALTVAHWHHAIPT